METPADAMEETSVAASDAQSSVAVSNAASTLHGANPAQRAWARGLTARQKTMVKARTRDAAKLLAELEERHNSVEEHLELRAREAELVWRTELLALQRAAAAAVGRAEAALGASPAEGLAAQVRSELDAVASAAASWRGEAAALQERVRRKARESVARAAELATPSAGDAAAEAEAEARRQVEACDARVRDLRFASRARSHSVVTMPAGATWSCASRAS